MKNYPLNEIIAFMQKELSKHLSIDQEKIDLNTPFDKYGLDSAKAIMMVGKLEDFLDIELPSTLLWDYNNINALAEHLYKDGKSYE